MHEDDWFGEFNRKAAPRLRETFEKELGPVPEFLTELLQQLRESEEALPLAA